MASVVVRQSRFHIRREANIEVRGVVAFFNTYTNRLSRGMGRVEGKADAWTMM